MQTNRPSWRGAAILAMVLVCSMLLGPGNARADRNDPVEPLPRVQSLQHLKDLIKQQQNSYRTLYKTGMIMEDAVMAPEAAATSNEAQGDYSGTNVQVEGVDEADLVKNDGSYIYQVNPSEVLIIKAVPADQMKIAARISFTSASFNPAEMYVDNNTLVIVGNSYQYRPPVYSPQTKVSVMPPMYDSRPITSVMVYDITDRSRPSKIRELELEGSYLTSRRINSALYVISQQPTYHIMEAESFSPVYRDSVKADSFIDISPDKIAYCPNTSYSSLMMLAAVRLDQPAQPAQIEMVLGSAENVYASAGGLYLAAPLYHHYPVFYDRVMPYQEEDRTQIFKFELADGVITYTARGEVPGHTLNQFSMDEYEGYFRIATTSGQEWWRNQSVSSNNVYTLDSQLTTVGRLENIAPGELIYSTRFMGHRAFMVTFRTVDPFFVIDLSNPNDPHILGKLKIPGYSNYLHPYDENNIIGFGKDTIELKTPYGEPQAYYQGMKMAMFDVSNLAQPLEKDKEIIGDRGTDSELLSNHKALLFSRDKNLLAFPVTVMKNTANPGSPQDVLAYGSFDFQGAYVYRVDAQGFSLKGRISHLTADDYLKAGDYWGGTDKNIHRILYIGDHIYTISPAMIQANRISDLSVTGSVSLSN